MKSGGIYRKTILWSYNRTKWDSIYMAKVMQKPVSQGYSNSENLGRNFDLELQTHSFIHVKLGNKVGEKPIIILSGWQTQ